MELKIEAYKSPEAIVFNYEELKAELLQKVAVYESMVYTDEQISEAKTDRANLNRLKKALNDERIRREKEYMQPFNEFKAQIAEIIGIIDKPVAVIDKQVKAFEEQKKAEKLDSIKRYFESIVCSEWLTFNQIFSEKWLNASVNMKTITAEINTKLDTIAKDLETLRNLPEFGFEAAEVYKTTLDINKAIAEGHRLAEIQKRKEEAEKEAEKAKQLTETMTINGVEFSKIENGVAFKCPPVQTEQPKECIEFRAWLSVEDSLALKAFFQSRNIEFEAI